MVQLAPHRPTAVPVDDATLVYQIRDGDERAFRALYLRYARYVAGVAYRLLGAEEIIEDVVQETFVAAAEGIKNIRHPERVRFWLATIAVRQVKKHLKKRIRRRQLGREVAQVQPPTSDPRELEDLQTLYRYLDELPVKNRMPWILYRIEGHALPEVAKLCGVSLATVKRRLAKAETSLKRRFGHG
jgi:RNA polymerase sigma-70 factor (ECF subfamily)